MKRLRILFDPNPIEFTMPAALGPYPYVKKFGSLRLTASAGDASGIGAGESPSMTVQLTNGGNRVALLIGQPLRVAAEIWDDEDESAPYFAGLIQTLVYGNEIDLTIEA